MPAKCKFCDRVIAADSQATRCTACSREFHTYCARERLDPRDGRVDWGSWRCERCVADALRVSQSLRLDQAAPVERGSGQELSPSSLSSVSEVEQENAPLTAAHFNKFMVDLAGKLTDQFNGLREDVNQKVQQINDSLMACTADICKLRQENDSLRKRVSDLELKVAESDVNSVHAELVDRQERENNVMVFGIPEGGPGGNGGDAQSVHDILTAILPGQELNILDVRRVGRIGQNSARPVKVMFENREVVRLVLKNKAKLAGVGVFRGVRIGSDLTPSQQSHVSDLRKELQRRKASGESNIGIRHFNGQPKIVTFQKSKRRRSEEVSPGQQGLRSAKKSTTSRASSSPGQ